MPELSKYLRLPHEWRVEAGCHPAEVGEGLFTGPENPKVGSQTAGGLTVLIVPCDLDPQAGGEDEGGRSVGQQACIGEL
jgi:hypothetical protein